MRPVPSNEEYIAEIGRFIVEFQTLEGEVKGAVCHFVNQRDFLIGLSVVGHLTFRALIEVCESLAHHVAEHDDEVFKALRVTMAQAASISEFRNKLVHSQWLVPAVGHEVGTRMKTGKGRDFHFDFEDVSLTDLREQTVRVRATHDQLIDILRQLRLRPEGGTPVSIGSHITGSLAFRDRDG